MNANQPTQERRRRSRFDDLPAIATDSGPARAGSRMYRATSTLERLRRDGSISPRQAEAGDRLRTHYDIGIAGTREAPTGSAQTGMSYPEYRLTAVRAYQLAVKALGPHLAAIVEPIAIGRDGGGDVTLSQLAKLLHRNRQELTGQLKIGLTILADHYGLT